MIKMRKAMLYLLAAVAAVLVATGTALAQSTPPGTLDANNLDDDASGEALFVLIEWSAVAQSFTAEHDGKITGAQVGLSKYAYEFDIDAYDITAEITDVDGSGAPGSVLASTKIPGSAVTGATFEEPSLVNMAFENPPEVKAGQRYALTLTTDVPERNDGTYGGFYVEATNAESYCHGALFTRDPAAYPPEPWWGGSGPDAIFAIYVEALSTEDPPQDTRECPPPPPPPPPDTSITTAPTMLYSADGLTKSTTATFNFSSNDPAATFECKLDGAAFEACASPKEYTALSDDRHTFEVRAKNAGGADETPATHTWTVDTTAPKVSATTPTGGATGVGRTTDLTATFSEGMDPHSVTKSTFQLYKCQSTTSTKCASQITDVAVFWRPSIDGSRTVAVLDPTKLLASTTKYKAVVTTGAKDVVGHALDQDPSASGAARRRCGTSPPDARRGGPPEGSGCQAHEGAGAKQPRPSLLPSNPPGI